MRSVFLSMILASSLGACATVSMVSSEAVVETGLSTEQSSLREVSEAYTDLAERKHWVAKSGGLLGFARVLMDGASGVQMKVNGVPMGGVWLVSLGKMNSGVRLKRFSSGSDIKAMSFLKVLE